VTSGFSGVIDGAFGTGTSNQAAGDHLAPDRAGEASIESLCA